MKKILVGLIVILGFAGTALALPTASSQQTLLPFVTNTYDLGSTLLYWRSLYTNQICLSGDCKSSWPAGGGGGGGGGTFSTSTISGYPNVLTNYPNNNTDVVTIGATGTSTAKFYFDPNISKAFIANGSSTAYTATNLFATLFKLGGENWYTMLGTTTAPSIGELSMWSGVNKFSSVGTTTLTASSPLSLSNPVVKVGGSNSILTLDTSGTWSGNAGTATALAGNGSNCSAGNYPLGVDASGNAENCTLATTGTVTSVGLSDTNSTLTIGSTPVTTSGTITATLNLGHTNTWSALQNFLYSSTTGYASFLNASSTNGYIGTLNLPNVTGTQCLHSIGGVVSGTGSDCGSGGGGLSSYDAFSHPVQGQSATTSLMLFNGNASSTGLSANYGYFNYINATSTTGTNWFGDRYSLFAGVPPVAGLGTTNAQVVISTNVNNLARGLDIANVSTGANAETGITFENANSTNAGASSAYIAGLAFGSPNFSTAGFGGLAPNGLAMFNTDGRVDIGATSANPASSTVNLYAGNNGSFGGGMPDLTLTVTGGTNAGGTPYLGIGTTTPKMKVVIAASTTPQLMLEGNDTDNGISLRSIGNFLYFATSSPSTYATSSPFAWFDPNGAFNLKPKANILVNGQNATSTIILTAGGATKTGSFGTILSGPTNVEYSTNLVNTTVMDFATSTTKLGCAYWNLTTPSSYDGLGMQATFYYTATTSTGNASWGIRGGSFGSGSALDTALSATTTVTTTFGTVNQLQVSAQSTKFTPAGAVAGSQLMVFHVCRAMPTDTFGASLRLMQVKLEYTKRSYSDE